MGADIEQISMGQQEPCRYESDKKKSPMENTLKIWYMM